jgi:hypothetical protein
MAAVAHEAYADVREAIIGLRASVQPDGIAATLKDYLAKYSRRAGIHAELQIDGDWRLASHRRSPCKLCAWSRKPSRTSGSTQTLTGRASASAVKGRRGNPC